MTDSVQKSPEGDREQEVESVPAEMSAEEVAETVEAEEVMEDAEGEQLFYVEPEPVETFEVPDAGRSEDVSEDIEVAGTIGAADFEECRQFGEIVAEEAQEPAVDDSTMFAMPDEVRSEEPFTGISDDSAFSFDDMLDGLTDSAGKPASSEVDALLREADGDRKSVV